MPDKTTIQIYKSTKEALDDKKLDDESYDDCIQRLVGDSQKPILWKENEIRRIAREEAENAISDAVSGRL